MIVIVGVETGVPTTRVKNPVVDRITERLGFWLRSFGRTVDRQSSGGET